MITALLIGTKIGKKVLRFWQNIFASILGYTGDKKDDFVAATHNIYNWFVALWKDHPKTRYTFASILIAVPLALVVWLVVSLIWYNPMHAAIAWLILGVPWLLLAIVLGQAPKKGFSAFLLGFFAGALLLLVVMPVVGMVWTGAIFFIFALFMFYTFWAIHEGKTFNYKWATRLTIACLAIAFVAFVYESDWLGVKTSVMSQKQNITQNNHNVAAKKDADSYLAKLSSKTWEAWPIYITVSEQDSIPVYDFDGANFKANGFTVPGKKINVQIDGEKPYPDKGHPLDYALYCYLPSGELKYILLKNVRKAEAEELIVSKPAPQETQQISTAAPSLPTVRLMGQYLTVGNCEMLEQNNNDYILDVPAGPNILCNTGVTIQKGDEMFFDITCNGVNSTGNNRDGAYKLIRSPEGWPENQTPWFLVNRKLVCPQAKFMALVGHILDPQTKTVLASFPLTDGLEAPTGGLLLVGPNEPFNGRDSNCARDNLGHWRVDLTVRKTTT
ncbi:hypothetical protein KJ840_00205 [Patescibacteria group bacterium]|nr:hypothetical protein [Patescibacteria group bacterium]